MQIVYTLVTHGSPWAKNSPPSTAYWKVRSKQPGNIHQDTWGHLTHWNLNKMADIWQKNIFKYIFLYENCHIKIKISLKCVPKGPINNEPALVQIMAWCLFGTKPLSEPMMAYFTDTYVTQPQWVNRLKHEQNGQQLADILKSISKNNLFFSNFAEVLSLDVLLTIRQYWFRWW